VLLPRGQNNSKGASLSLSYNTIFIDAAKISQLFFLNWGFMPKHGNIAERWLVERSHLVEREKKSCKPTISSGNGNEASSLYYILF